MKKLILQVCLLAMPFAGAMAQKAPLKPFAVVGDVSSIKDPIEWVYLTYVVDGTRKTDSVQVKKGEYAFSGELAEAALARVRVTYQPKPDGSKAMGSGRRDQAVVFLQPGKINIVSTDSFSNVKVKGSAAHDEYLKIESLVAAENKKMEELNVQYTQYYRNKNEEEMKKMIPQFEELQKQIRMQHKKYVQENPKSPIAIYALNQFAGYEIDSEEVEPVYNALPAATKSLPSAKAFQEKLEIAKKTAIGRSAMEFTQNDTLGKPVSLSSFKGKYLLIDFWASWCGPCRQENPNVVAAFNKYKDKNFHVLGVSLDQPNAKEKWMKAIHDDQLWWTHVSDLQYWKNSVAVQYGIQSIPANLLLDPQGKIIGKNLRGEELQKKLNDLFAQQ